MRAASTQWQLALDAAERYERILVPAILGPFARALVQWAGLHQGEAVLDAGCGTGAAARYAVEIVSPGGRVTGLDINAGMLDVARSLPPLEGATLQWREGSAADLPWPESTFDAVLCAQSLQFFPDRPRALGELRRVLKPGGLAAISLWRPIGENPYFAALVEAVSRYIGRDTAQGLGAIFNLSNPQETHSLLSQAGFRFIVIHTEVLELPLPALEEFVPRHISATPMAAGFAVAEEPARRAILEEVFTRLQTYGPPNAPITIPFRSYFLRARKP